MPYAAGKPGRSARVLRTGEPQRGVRRRDKRAPALRITRLQARLAFLAALAAMAASGGWWAYHAPWLTVDEVRVEGTALLTAEQVRAAADIDGDSILRLDLAAAERRVEALPEVRSATATKHGWNRATIAVEERVAWGSWQIDGVDVPVDVDGYVLSGAAAPDGSPRIVEVNPQRALNAGDRLDRGAIELADRLTREAERTLGRTVLLLAYRQDAGLTAVLSTSDIDGESLWVTFGDARDYEYKIAALYVLIEEARANDVALHSVDLRFGDRLSFN